MQITDIATIVLRLPEVRADGDGAQDVLVVLVRTDAGLTGIGEVHTSPTVADAVIHAPLSHLRSRGLASVLVGQDPLHIDDCWQLMQDASEVYGRRGVALHAISGVDLALWDLRGKVQQTSVADLLGGRNHPVLDTYASVLMPDTVEAARALALDCADQGFTAMKFGWGGLGGGIDHAATLVGAVRDVAPSADLMVDVGTGLVFDDALRLARELEPFDLRFLEEPLHPDDLDGFARLTEQSPIPIATGEKETSLAGFDTLIRLGHPDIIQPDLARAGGFTEVERIWRLAEQRSTRLIPHCWSTDILVSATAHFLASRPDPLPLEFCLQDHPLRRDLATAPLRAIQGRVTVPDGPGLGIDLDPAIVQRFGVSYSQPVDDILETLRS